MSTVDSHVASILDKHTDKIGTTDTPDSDDEDALLDELERDEGAMDAFRERRLQQLHDEMARARKMKSENLGVYTETMTEKEVMDLTTSRKYAIIHFYHPDFRRCKIMDSHLEVLARKHFDTLVTKINVENCPFLVERLKVQVLPCLMCFVDGMSVDRIVGFELGEEMGVSDGFQTGELEARFLRCGVFQRAKTTEATRTSIFGKTAEVYEDDDDWD